MLLLLHLLECLLNVMSARVVLLRSHGLDDGQRLLDEVEVGRLHLDVANWVSLDKLL